MTNYHTPKIRVSYARAHELFKYDEKTGVITRRCDCGRGKKGDTFKPRATGYVIVTIDGIDIAGHHLAWLLWFREYPEHMIDHADNDKSNNAIANLRYTNTSHNGLNRKCFKGRYRGVAQVSTYRFVAYAFGRNFEKLGTYNSAEEAAIARDDYVIKHFGRGHSPLNFECEETRAKTEAAVLLLRLMTQTTVCDVNGWRAQGLFSNPKLAVPVFKKLLAEAH